MYVGNVFFFNFVIVCLCLLFVSCFLLIVLLVEFSRGGGRKRGGGGGARFAEWFKGSNGYMRLSFIFYLCAYFVYNFNVEFLLHDDIEDRWGKALLTQGVLGI